MNTNTKNVQTLFNLPIINTDTKAIENTCKDCEHRERWQCNSKIIQYCGVRKSKRTQNGLLKIKCKDKACLLFKPYTKTN